MNTKEPGNSISRRTGLDRRWIPSANHQPERRRSRDRRTIRNRSFLEPFESKDAPENRTLFPEISIQAGRQEANHTDPPQEEKEFSVTREAVFKRGMPDDG